MCVCVGGVGGKREREYVPVVCLKKLDVSLRRVRDCPGPRACRSHEKGSEGKSPFSLSGLSLSVLLVRSCWAEQSESRLVLGRGRGPAGSWNSRPVTQNLGDNIRH